MTISTRGELLNHPEFISVIAGILGQSPSSIDPALSLEEIGWDSLCLLSLIAEVDASVGSSIDISEVHKAITVGDLFECISSDGN